MKLKGGIIGFGFIAAEGHLPAFRARKDIEISSVCDQNPEREIVSKEMLGDCRFYSSPGEMFDRENLDFVDIATSPASHKDYILEALSRGLHVLCEKPLVLKEDELREIASHPNFDSKSVYTVHNWKYAPIFQQAFELLDSGCIGQIKTIRYEVLRTGPSVTVSSEPGDLNWRLKPEVSGGGILVDHGWHAFYTLWRLMGGLLPLRLRCTLENRKFKDLPIEDTASVKIYFDRGEADIFFTWTAQERKNRVVMEGNRGELAVLDNVLCLVNQNGKKEYPFEQGLSQGSHHPEWYPSVIRDFVESMKNEKNRNRNLKEAALSLALMTAAQRSHQEGGAPVTIDSDFAFLEGKSQ